MHTSATRHSAPRVASLLSAAFAAYSLVCTAQAPLAGPPPVKLYDSIRIAAAADAYNGDGFRVRANNDLEAVNETLNSIIAFAYDVHPKRIVNAPTWADTEHFDMAVHFTGSGVPDNATCRQMLRDALKERFGLVLHTAGKASAGYAIHVEPQGTKLVATMQPDAVLPAFQMPQPGKLEAHNATITEFAAELQRNVLDRPVADETSDPARYDFLLKWKANAAAGDDTRKNLAEAMKQQLGLRLDDTQAPPSDLIIDHAQLPSGL